LFILRTPLPILSISHANIALSIRSIKIKGADCGFDALFLAVITSIGGFLFGYDIGQISGIVLFTNFTDRFLNTGSATNKSLLVSLMSVGCLFGSLLGA
jgi:SP family sugar:H+ symporter-like MFS transporter